VIGRVIRVGCVYPAFWIVDIVQLDGFTACRAQSPNLAHGRRLIADAKTLNRARQTCSFQDVEDVLNRQRRIAERGDLIVKNLQDRVTVDVEEHRNELIRVHRHQVESAERWLRKVPKVERDDDRCVAMERSRNDMTVVSVWQLDSVDPMLVARDVGIADRSLHQRPGPSQRGGGQVWPIKDDVAEAFVEDRGAPASAV